MSNGYNTSLRSVERMVEAGYLPAIAACLEDDTQEAVAFEVEPGEEKRVAHLIRQAFAAAVEHEVEPYNTITVSVRESEVARVTVSPKIDFAQKASSIPPAVVLAIEVKEVQTHPKALDTLQLVFILESADRNKTHVFPMLKMPEDGMDAVLKGNWRVTKTAPLTVESTR